MSLFNEKEEKDINKDNVEAQGHAAPKAVANVSNEALPEVGYIAAGTKIEGNFFSNGSLVFNGEITGTTTVKGNLVLNGVSSGDISCTSLLTGKFTCNANLTATENIILKEGTVITGDINCKNITVYGKVNGNINATGYAVFKATSVINGDVEVGKIAIETGAKLNGKVAIR